MKKHPFMQDKVVLITGSTNSIGKQTTWQITQTGATAVITGCNEAKLAQVMAKLKPETSNPHVRAYSQSKLANLMFTFELVKQLAGTSVTINALHPSMLQTEFGCNNKGLVRWVTGIVLGLMQQFRAVNIPQGADTAIYLACSPQVGVISGAYWYRLQQKQSSLNSFDKAQWKRLWHISTDIVQREGATA